MPVEDGLLARLRPHLSRLTRAQVLGLCDAAERFGNGLVEVTNRASLQIRGLTDASHPGFIAAVRSLGLLDPDEETEARRSILTQPFWQPGDDTERVADALLERLTELPELPAKFGIVVDLGPRPVLHRTPGDIRVERGASGPVVRADGHVLGRPATVDSAVAEVIDLARWFASRRSETRRRMAQVVAHEGPPPRSVATPLTGDHAPTDRLTALPAEPFAARHLADAVGSAEAVRLSPWRAIIGEHVLHEVT
ncbi:MAG: hypothetical protein AAF762_07875 [Pseudomonadota bacterium]